MKQKLEQNDLEAFEMVDPVVFEDDSIDLGARAAASDNAFWFKDKCSQLKKGVFQTPWDIWLDIMLKLSGGTLCNAANFEEVFSSYMLCRFLSMDKTTIGSAVLLDVFNAKDILTSRELYRLAYAVVPKRTEKWLPKYIKKDAAKKKPSEDEDQPAEDASMSSAIFDL